MIAAAVPPVPPNATEGLTESSRHLPPPPTLAERVSSSATDEQRRAFPPPVEGLRQDPVAQELPESVTAALADLKGEQSSVTVDITTIGDYFKDHGGRQALHTFLKAALSADQVKGLPLTGEFLISAGATEVGRGALHDMPAFQ